MRIALAIIFLVLCGVGCMPAAETSRQATTQAPAMEQRPGSDATAVLPVAGYVERRTFKAFGEYVSDRFSGYHAADDIEFVDVAEEVPVAAVMNGTVVRIGRVPGYGGMALIDHGSMNAIYGHLDLASTNLQAGDLVTMGQFIANLGDGESTETDGERKHLHFGLYEGAPTLIDGYVDAAAVDAWINPQDFFTEHGIDMTTDERTFTSSDLGGDVYRLEFAVPEGMEVEYIPSLQSLNIFTLSGEGTARERSQILLRYFDASEFLTLSTVDVITTQDLTVGAAAYPAKRYEIEKKTSAADFMDQPSWRNARHVVTDFTNASGYGRYYVVASNPKLDPVVYEEFLQNIVITP